MDGDLTKFRHGSEGTHGICKKRLEIEGGDGRCCSCFPHEDCEINAQEKKNL